jgi:hypothetical protein
MKDYKGIKKALAIGILAFSIAAPASAQAWQNYGTRSGQYRGPGGVLSTGPGGRLSYGPGGGLSTGPGGGLSTGPGGGLSYGPGGPDYRQDLAAGCPMVQGAGYYHTALAEGSRLAQGRVIVRALRGPLDGSVPLKLK